MTRAIVTFWRAAFAEKQPTRSPKTILNVYLKFKCLISISLSFCSNLADFNELAGHDGRFSAGRALRTPIEMLV